MTLTGGLLEVGRLPKRSHSPGRKPGKWRGHEQMAQELRVTASRQRDPEDRWGKVAERLSSTKSQSIASAIKKGEAVGFEPTAGGRFEATARKSPDQTRAPAGPNGQSRVLYDVWARWMPTVE